MMLGDVHINIVKGDFRYPLWKDGEFSKYKKKIHELRCDGYRKIHQESDFLNSYEFYRKKKKRVVCVTLMHP